MASLILYMLRYLFKYISFVFYSVKLLTNSAAASGFLCTDRRRRHRRHLRFCLPAEWAMQTGKQHITQAFRGPLSRGLLPCVVGCGSSPKGRGLWSWCCCCCCCWRTRWLSKPGDSNDSGACRQSAADNTRSHSANWAYCSCRQLVPIATIGRSVDQSISQSLESNRASVKFVIVIIISALCLRPAGAHTQTHTHTRVYMYLCPSRRGLFLPKVKRSSVDRKIIKIQK